MTITSRSLRFLYIFGRSGPLCGSRHHIGNTHSCLLLYYILAEEELLSLLAAEMVSVEINVHDNASIVVIVLKIWWCPLWLLRLLLLRLHDGENLVKKSG